MSEISFTVWGDPVAQGRPRAGKGPGGHVRMYDPAKSKDYKHFVKLTAAQHRPDKLIEGEIELVVDVYRSIPKSFSKKKRALAIAGDLRPTTKPDVDNYVKGIKDGISGVIWHDDRQVVSLLVRKWYAEAPRVEVKISEVSHEQSG